MPIADSALILNGSASLQAVSSLSAVAGLIKSGSSSIQALATVTSAGQVEANGISSISSVWTLAGIAENAARGASAVSSLWSVSALARNAANGLAGLTSAWLVNGTGSNQARAIASLSGLWSVNGSGAILAYGSCSIASLWSLLASGSVELGLTPIRWDEWIHGRLSGNGDIVSLVSDRILPVPANLDCPLPFITFKRSSTLLPSPLSNADPFRRYSVDVRIVAGTKAELLTLAELVESELHLLDTSDATCFAVNRSSIQLDDAFQGQVNFILDLDR